MLDIGCWGGCYSFEAEQRGAREVRATDLIPQREFSVQPTFEIVRAARRSHVECHPNMPVVDAEAFGITDPTICTRALDERL